MLAETHSESGGGGGGERGRREGESRLGKKQPL